MSESRPLTRRQRKAIAWLDKTCANCDAPLQGPFCHVCGQPEKTPIRDVISLGSDALDYLFDVDARLWRTLRDLFVRPGRLTQGYLAGKRMSFVRPLRIYLITSAILFIVISSMAELDMKVSEDGDIKFGPVTAGSEPRDVGADAPADAAVNTTTDSAPAADSQTPTPAAKPGEQPTKVDTVPAATADSSQKPTPAGAPDQKPAKERKPIEFKFGGPDPWHPVDNPLVFESLPTIVNDRINLFIGLLRDNVELAREDPKRLGAAFLRVLPQSLFVLLPLFALLLKVVLIFKRRLYMEHLMVAIHSHTFIYMAILVIIGFNYISEWVGPAWEWIPNWIVGLTSAWIPLNLFLTQKRVYRQTWWGAMFAFSIVSAAYLFLITFTILGALVLSLANL